MDDSNNYIECTIRCIPLEIPSTAVVEYLDKLIDQKSYIWNNQRFSLDLCSENPNILKGKTFIGEFLTDEWFIVGLLIDLSKKFKDLVINVVDNDGDFLLFEAALKISNKARTSFIKNGKVHIIYDDESINLSDPLNSSSEASTSVQKIIYNRIPKVENVHYVTKCILPRDIVRMLDEMPQLLAYALVAFNERDDENSASSVYKNKLFFPPSSCVVSKVRFKKDLYAKVCFDSKFSPHLDFLSFPAAAGIIKSSTDSAEFKMLDIGMKIAFGFELLNLNKFFFLEFDPKFTNYLEKSKKLACLTERNSKDFFFSTRISYLKQAEIPSLENFLKNSKLKYPTNDIFDSYLEETGHWDSVFESDEWLNVSHTDVEELLHERLGHKGSKNSRSADKKSCLENMVNDFERFVNLESGHEGVDDDVSELSSYQEDYDDDEHLEENVNVVLEKMEKMFKKKYENIEFSESESEYLDEDQEIMHDLMKAMDRDLASNSCSRLIDFTDDYEIESNLAKNIVEGFEAQQGYSGPLSSIINSMGFIVPKDDDDDKIR